MTHSTMNYNEAVIYQLNQLRKSVASICEILEELPIPDDEYDESVIVGASEKYKLRVWVDPTDKYRGNPYLKVADATVPKKGESGVARLHFLDDEIEYHRRDRNGFKIWSLSRADIDDIRSYLQEKNQYFTQYTNWQIAIWSWDSVYFSEYISYNKLHEFMRGEFNNDKSICNHPSYVPSTATIPNWSYDSKKVKEKGLETSKKLSKEVNN